MLEKKLAPSFAPGVNAGPGELVSVPGGDFARPPVKEHGEHDGAVGILGDEALGPASEHLVHRGVDAADLVDVAVGEGGADVAKLQRPGSKEIAGGIAGVNGARARKIWIRKGKSTSKLWEQTRGAGARSDHDGEQQ